MNAVSKAIRIRVEHADAVVQKVDVLVLKYAQKLYGLDRSVADILERAGIEVLACLPEEEGYYLIDSMNHIGARSVLFVGVEQLISFRYKQIRNFARRALEILAAEAPETKRICFTLHGANYGLDQVEAFQSEIAGLVDALNAGVFPRDLTNITVAETSGPRAQLLQKMLYELLPDGYYDNNAQVGKKTEHPATSERLRNAGYTSETKPHVFVAMPFAEEMADIYDYGISKAVNEAGFMCERADLSSFTGDILEWVKHRIKTASLVLADLTGANPNVYLEVGYAWGCDIPTILIVRDVEKLKFDVQGQRCLTYRRIKDLEGALQKEMSALRETLHRR